MLKDIIEVRPLSLHLRFEDGTEGIVDVAKLVKITGVFAPIKERDFFQVQANQALESLRMEKLKGAAVSSINLQGVAKVSLTDIWREVLSLPLALKVRLLNQVRVIGADGLYARLAGQRQISIVADGMGNGQAVAFSAVSDKDWRVAVKWLMLMLIEPGGEVTMTDHP